MPNDNTKRRGMRYKPVNITYTNVTCLTCGARTQVSNVTGKMLAHYRADTDIREVWCPGEE